MLPTLTALMVAVVVTVLYLVLTEQLDYASVRRRQLDVWAAAAALGCMGLVLYGNASVRRTVEDTATPSPAPDERSAPVLRRTPVPLEQPPAEVAPEPVVVIVTAPDAEAGSAGDAGTRADDAGVDTDDRELVSARTPVAVVSLPETPAPALATLSVGPAVPTRTPGSGPGVPPRPAPTKTPQPPPTATSLPTPLPQATPHCGDPTEIVVSVENLRSHREDAGGELVVVYGFDLRNESPFPVTVVDNVVTVVRSVGGGEQYATQFLDDVTIEAGAVFPVQRHVTLETRPPPFGSVRICVNFFTESCGVRKAGDRADQCQAIEGF